MELGRELDLVRAPIGSSSPPVVVGNVVVVGSALPSGGAPRSPEMPPGHVRGYDAVTGELVWTFHTIPQAGEYGNETWEDGSWEYTGNAAVWPPFSADPELGYVYLPVELGTGDFYGGHRLGDNLFSQSIVALEAATGERVWHFQTVHHGIWDYDPPTAPILADLVVDGREIPAVALLTKQTFTFVFDRRTGEPVWPIEERPVPQTDVPGRAHRAHAALPHPAAALRPAGRRPRRDHRLHPRAARRGDGDPVAAASRTPLHAAVPARRRGHPGHAHGARARWGGVNWPGGALDPETGYLYVQSATTPNVIGLAPVP